MFVWGSGGDVIDLGTVETHDCKTCEKEREFRLMLEYRYWGIYWIFNTVTQKQYSIVCDVCHRGRSVSAKEVESYLDSVPIPVMHRFGCLVFIGLIALLILIGSLG